MEKSFQYLTTSDCFISQMAESLIKFSKNKILIDRREPKRVTDSLWNNWLWQMVFYVGPTTYFRPPAMLYISMAGWRVDNLACSTQCLIVSYFKFCQKAFKLNSDFFDTYFDIRLLRIQIMSFSKIQRFIQTPIFQSTVTHMNYL